MNMARISVNHLERQKRLHLDPFYGDEASLYAPLVVLFAEQYRAKSISDYGAGKCVLQKKIIELGLSGLKYYPYDPVFPHYGAPKAADLVCCINVLEHIELIHLKPVILDLSKIIKNIGLFTIHTGSPSRRGSDIENSYLIQQPTSWWIPLFCEHFEIIELESTAMGFWALVKGRSLS
jgi:hypothetical protein